MTIKSRRKVIKIGDSRAVTIPSQLFIGVESSLAANRLILLDPRGEIPEGDLLQFLEDEIEPLFWPWLTKKTNKNLSHDQEEAE